MSGDAPFHAHIYYEPAQRPAATALRDRFRALPSILFVGGMIDRGIGPHPMPQYEVHCRESSVAEVVAMIEETGLRALVHPLTDDDLADHTSLARWIGEPVPLDLGVLDPPGRNKGMARFARRDL